MWDLIVSVPDYCFFFLIFFSMSESNSFNGLPSLLSHCWNTIYKKFKHGLVIRILS